MTTPSFAASDNAIRAARAGDLRAAVGLARHAYRMARAEGLHAQQWALNALALVQGAHGMFIESVATSIDAFKLAQELGERAGSMHALVTMSGAASFILETDEVSIAMLAIGTREAKALGDVALQVRIDNTLGILHLNRREFAEADAAYDRALAAVGPSDSRAALFTPDYLIAGNQTFMHIRRAIQTLPPEHDEVCQRALARILRAIDVAREHANVDAEARALFGLGMLQAHLGQTDQALAAFVETVSIAQRIHHAPRLVDTYIEMAGVHATLGDLKAALSAYDDAFEIADAHRPTSKLSRICEGIADVYAGLGMAREASHFQAKAQHERDVFSRENDHAMRDIKAFWERLEASAG
ncbi:MAG TPA: tetratricopeptide repeat protein [Usitatibacteraceae bacterium]|nr:tetratricopeptide repeat protein [Usitatibacteraceae bacterium]